MIILLSKPFRTAKYHPAFPPKGFADLNAAREWAAGFVHWYNNDHHHSGITDGGCVKTCWVSSDCGICLCGGVKIGTEPPGRARIVLGGTLDDTSWLKSTAHWH